MGGRTESDSLVRGGKNNGQAGEEEKDDLTLKCIAPIRVLDFGRVESQLFLFFPFSLLIFLSFLEFLFFPSFRITDF